jgi:hypothetical protein
LAAASEADVAAGAGLVVDDDRPLGLRAIACAIARESTSVPPAGGNGTTS